MESCDHIFDTPLRQIRPSPFPSSVYDRCTQSSKYPRSPSSRSGIAPPANPSNLRRKLTSCVSPSSPGYSATMPPTSSAATDIAATLTRSEINVGISRTCPASPMIASMSDSARLPSPSSQATLASAANNRTDHRIAPRCAMSVSSNSGFSCPAFAFSFRVSGSDDRLGS